jgi:hypothetical protein
MPHRRRGLAEPSHVCLAQTVGLSRCRHSRHGAVRSACHAASTFLRPFARRALPRFLAPMDALTPGRPALRILIRDNELRPCTRPGLPASYYRTLRPFRLQPPAAASGLVWFDPGAYRAVCQPHPFLGTRASLGLRLFLAGSPRQPAESSSSSCGPAVHLQLLSTPSREDAVTFGYQVQTNLGKDFHLADSIHSQAH